MLKNRVVVRRGRYLRVTESDGDRGSGLVLIGRRSRGEIGLGGASEDEIEMTGSTGDFSPGSL